MINRTKITLAILVITLAAILVGCTVEVPPFAITETAHETIVCSIAPVSDIETYVSVNHAEYGESTGLIWQPNQNCVVYGK